MACLYGYILFQFWFHPFPFPNDHNFHIGLPYTRFHLSVTLNKQGVFDVLRHFKPLCPFQWFMSHTVVKCSHHWFAEVPSCFFSWCKFTIEQIYCNLCVNLCFPTEWERGQQNSSGRLEIEILHIQHPHSQKQGSVSRRRKKNPNHTNPIQQTNWWSDQQLLENKYYKEFVNWWTDLHTPHSSFVVALCVHPITFHGCCTRLLGFGTVKMKQRLCGTICQAAEAKDS